MLPRSICAALLLTCVVHAQSGSATSRHASDSAAKEQLFWSFQPLRKPVVPPTMDGKWPRGSIDRFLLARLEAAGLRPAPAVSARALLRRLVFDLTGLPPTPEMIAEFEKDSSDGAYDRTVDRLLASKSFGERWGRHWLDVVRFAESSGGGRSLMFAHAWRFRDYVIDAYNSDRRFDVFVAEQIAGDLMPHKTEGQRNRQLIATGFLELGPTNYELQDKELLRMEVIDEQVDTVGLAFLGLTLGCARCHDHKFDPILTTDYYALAGVFGGTQVLTAGNVSGHVQRELATERSRARRAYDKRVKAIRRELAKLGGGRRGRSRPRVLERAALIGIVLDDEDAKRIGAWTSSTSNAGYLERGYIHDGDTEKGRKSVVFTPDVPRTGLYDVRVSYTFGTNRASNAPVRIEGADGTKLVHVDQRRAPSLDGFTSVGRYRMARGRGNKITLSNERTDGHVIVDGLQLIPVGDLETVKRPTSAARIARLRAELKQLEKAKPQAAERAMAVRDVPKPVDGHVHVRGLVRKKGPKVARGFVTACGEAKPDIPDGQSGRMQLAQWLTRPSHPLTTRVYVNRVWSHLFGVGIVRTTDNFGFMGERPSHPDLLDWLARRFMADGWSTKRLVREIVRSQAYRTASGASPRTDSENRLLSHANRRRLDAESLRDAILQISGQLDRAIGGSTIRKFSVYDYTYEFESRRRSVYVPRFRSNRMEIFDVFDAADPNLVTGTRNVSNVSTQALYLMNSPWVMAQAQTCGDPVARRVIARECTVIEGSASRPGLSISFVGRPAEHG